MVNDARTKWSLAMAALEEAHSRFIGVKDSREPGVTFAPLSEALWWTVIARSALKKHVGEKAFLEELNDEEKMILTGLQFARNRAAHTHEIPELLYLTRGGADLPVDLP